MKGDIFEKKFIKASVFFFLVVGGILFSFKTYDWYIDCWKNHSKTLQEVGKPMQDNVLDFYEEYQRYPSLEESIVLMEKAGCNNIQPRKHSETKNIKGEVYERWASYYCDYGSMTLGYGVTAGNRSVKSDVEPYGFGFRKGNTRCSGFFYSETIDGYFACEQDSCLFKNLSH